MSTDKRREWQRKIARLTGPLHPDPDADLARVEEQPPGAEATTPLSAGGSLPLPYVYRIDAPAPDPHHPEQQLLAYGTWDTAPAPMTTVHHAARYAVQQARVMHQYWGALTVQVWAHRGADEHYLNPPPPTAYRMDCGDHRDTPPRPSGPPHNAVWWACEACHHPNKREAPGTTTEGSTGGSSG